MSLADARTLTAEDLFALPDDGNDREIRRGVLRERPMTRRDWMHSGAESNLVFELGSWLETRPSPRGAIYGYGCGFRLKRDPETFVGIDVAYASAELVATRDRKVPFYDGPPVLAVEILSPSDMQEDIVEKVGLYLEVGTVVWVVDPDFRTIRVHRPGEEPLGLNASQELSGEPYLPGFRVPVARIFE